MMNAVHTGPRPIDGGTEREGLSTLVVATLATAIFVIGGLMFYSLSNSPPASVTAGYSPITDSFKALEASPPAPTPPSTTGQGGAQ